MCFYHLTSARACEVSTLYAISKVPTFTKTLSHIVQRQVPCRPIMWYTGAVYEISLYFMTIYMHAYAQMLTCIQTHKSLNTSAISNCF